MNTIIEIENMEFYSNHGCYHEEKLVGNHFVVNLRLEVSCHLAEQTDNIKDALNYQIAYEEVKKEMMVPSHLLEHVASRILNRLFSSLSAIVLATVKVSKLNPPMGGKISRVSVTLTRSKEEQEAIPLQGQKGLSTEEP